jgi:hypothetical protein
MFPLLMAAGAAVQVGGSIAKALNGAKREKEMREAIDNYVRQDLKNSYDNVGVSTMSADLQREEAGRFAATAVNSLEAGGVRGLVGGMGRLAATNNATQRQIGADLDRQHQTIEMQRAQDESRIRQMQEQREQADLAGMGAEMNAARQDKWAGIGDIGTSVMSTAAMGQAGAFGGEATGMFKGQGAMGAMGMFKPMGQAPSLSTQGYNPFYLGNNRMTTPMGGQAPAQPADPMGMGHMQYMNQVAPKKYNG